MRDVKDFLINFIEKENKAFNDFPVCPFAKKERIENRIKYVECSFNFIETDKIIKESLNWLNHDYSTLLFVSKEECDMETTRYFFKCVKALLTDHGVNVFLFHKSDKRSYMGIHTRRSPRPFIMVGYKDEIAKKKKKLLNTKYYDNLTIEEYYQLHPKRKKQNGKNTTNN
tara:strand:- start:328 stop:837 length:510 start_codon:yes stop_codon:yes gene_type:complete